MEEPPVQIFLDEAATWVEADDWPLPETRFTPFYRHEGGLLSEREHWPNEPHSVFAAGLAAPLPRRSMVSGPFQRPGFGAGSTVDKPAALAQFYPGPQAPKIIQGDRKIGL